MIGISGGTGRLVWLQQASVGGLEGQGVLSSPSALLSKGFFVCLTWKSKEREKWAASGMLKAHVKRWKFGLKTGPHWTPALAVCPLMQRASELSLGLPVARGVPRAEGSISCLSPYWGHPDIGRKGEQSEHLVQGSTALLCSTAACHTLSWLSA